MPSPFLQASDPEFLPYTDTYTRSYWGTLWLIPLEVALRNVPEGLRVVRRNWGCPEVRPEKPQWMEDVWFLD